MKNMQVPTILASVALIFACGSSSATESKAPAVAATPPVQPEATVIPDTGNAEGDGLFAMITTRLGEIKCKLDYENAPLTVANFVALSEGKQPNKAKADGVPYYDGTIFHRVIPGFMIQGGDPAGSGTGGPGYTFPDEFVPTSDLYKGGYARGVMAMANRGPNTNGSQFFIMHQDYALPYSYSIFGKVVSGMETVDAIAALPRTSDRPNEEVSMKVKIVAVGKAAKAFDAVKVLQANKEKFK
ncbi:MAG: peptidylprolyl isomerase [Flavobacteriales bacterium]